MLRMILSRMRRFLPALLLAGAVVSAQQVPDTEFSPQVAGPAFAEGEGPRVGIDEGHFNFHTAGGRYSPFAQLLTRDGFVVTPLSGKFDRSTLAEIDVLVISNALNARNVEDWSLPTPSAFEPGEVAAVRDWVAGGGALLLIADHMPFGGAAEELGRAFGFSFTNGYASQPGSGGGPLAFNRSDGSLNDHSVVRGRDSTERVDRVVTFTGQAFGAESGHGLLELPEGAIVLLPKAAGEFLPDTPRARAAGLYQGATRVLGEGRVAAFGEAAMFSAQLAGPNRMPMGMNSAGAEQNAQFALNVMHWLVGLLPEQ